MSYQLLQDTNPVFVLMEILGEDGIKTGVFLGLSSWGVYTVFCLGVGLLLLYWSSRLLLPRKNQHRSMRTQ